MKFKGYKLGIICFFLHLRYINVYHYGINFSVDNYIVHVSRRHTIKAEFVHPLVLYFIHGI